MYHLRPEVTRAAVTSAGQKEGLKRDNSLVVSVTRLAMPGTACATISNKETDSAAALLADGPSSPDFTL